MCRDRQNSSAFYSQFLVEGEKIINLLILEPQSGNPPDFTLNIIRHNDSYSYLSDKYNKRKTFDQQCLNDRDNPRRPKRSPHSDNYCFICFIAVDTRVSFWRNFLLGEGVNPKH